MDPTKLSLSSKAPHVNNGGGNESLVEEMVQGRDGVDTEKQRDSETRDPDADVTATAAEINHHHRGSADKQKYSTIGYQRRTKQKVVTDFATQSKGASAVTKPRAALRQVLFSQGVSDKTSEERGQLDVLKQDLEAYAVPASLKWKWKEESQGATLEKNWTEIVQSHSTMSKMQRHQQEALWEFVCTELTYINKLIIIKDLVIAALVHLQQRGFLPEVTPELLFSNLPSILSAHQLFWQEVIYPMLHEVRKTGKPFDPMGFEAGCLQFHERFSSYQYYCWEEESNLEFSRRLMESNPHFLTFVQWAENHPQCERMRLGEMQAKPHQRITKYSLLLKAVLKNSQDPLVQNALRGMISSVNSFLESINDYLRLKDEELALSISAQRVEGYEVDGINEEIDKYVREICRFDLTCPIRGVDPKVVRKLLLEENLKVRGRKDNKLEVVALLFSDVLLMTKVQKKGERLKVVRPPLALDRTYCLALKDGYSFVLVEVGELQSAMNVLILVASTSESCSTWVSTIGQAKQTLTNLRQMENNRLENLKIHQPEAKPATETKIYDTEPEEQCVSHPRRESFVDELTYKFNMSHSLNGSREAEQYQPPDEVATNNTGIPVRHFRPSLHTRKLARKNIAVRQQASTGYEWIELKRYQGVNHKEEEEGQIVESDMTKDQSVAWNHRANSVPYVDLFTHRTAADPFRYNTTGPHNILLGGLPDVDYPTDEDSTLKPHYQPAMSRESPDLLTVPRQQEILLRRDSDSQSVNLDIRRNSGSSQSGDMETSPDVWSFSKNLKSPGLRRRRPISTHQGPSIQTSKHFSQGSGQASTNYSSSNSDSECTVNLKRNSASSGSSSNSHRVLKLSSIKSNQGMFWNMHDRASPDPQAFSESELSDVHPDHKRPKIKALRRASIPTITIEGGHGTRLHSHSLHMVPQRDDANNSNENPSPLEGLLERAKERGRDKSVSRRDKTFKTPNMRTRYPPPSPSISTTPSPPPSEGDRDTELEEVPELMRHRALTVSKGWKEQLVDGDDDDLRNGVVFTDGVNVDWSGWCFDDDEVMDHLHPGDEGLLEGINRSLASWNLNDISEQDDGECSQV